MKTQFRRLDRRLAISTFLTLATALPAIAADEPEVGLHARNLEAPFCYRAGGERSWPICDRPLNEEQSVSLAARRDGEVVAQGSPIELGGLTVTVSRDGWLHVDSKSDDDDASFELEVTLGSESQKLTVRPAPPDRPLTYIADFGDDIIRIFGESSNRYQPIEKSGFDQYFRRLQAQGITRLIVWQSPFPYIVDPDNYRPEDWQRYEQQARAILDSQELTAGIEGRNGFSAWGWVRQLMALRLMPEFGEMLSQSAVDHGIKLTASFRPFEAALTKYYVVPAFDHEGRHLWDFQPLCSPVVNYHPDEVCFAHYRKILERMGKPEAGTLAAIELPGIENADELVKRMESGERVLELRASPFPPQADEALVLVRQESGGFELRPYAEIRDRTLSHLAVLEDVVWEAADDGLRARNISLPEGHRFLLLSQPEGSDVTIELSTERPVVLRSQAGNRLGGENVYFAFDETGSEPEPTRLSGIVPNGHFHAEFQATEASIERVLPGPLRIPLAGKQLVISLGADWSVEMMDFTQPAAREFAVKQLRTVLGYPAFDEIILNTRSHTQLAGYLGDDQGTAVRPIVALRRNGIGDYYQLGLDEAYAPRLAAEDRRLLALAGDVESVERITTLQPGEWRAVTCQTPEPFAWRYTRNRLVAEGVRDLLLDLEREFPETRIRAVIPPSAAAINRILENLDSLPDENGTPYGREFYRRLWCSNNHIPNIGEGMAMVDLTGTRVEPVFLGSGGYLNPPAPFEMYVRECIADLADNRGSSFRGPRSYFYEGQNTLRASDQESARRGREQMILHLLSHTDDIGEVILYEAADWTYFLPLSDPDLSGYGFLDEP
ncbi:MAG: hypothetical protein DWQ29_22245 [Planctomycetota bacterium]|nr:MAG: hypothetical protein DWQ29_22245 [Planctomycetota bacterium]